MTYSIKVLLIIFLPVVIACDRSAKKDEANKVVAGNTAAETRSDIPSKADATRWKADPDKTKIRFKVDGPFGVVDGSLRGFQSTIIFDEKDLSSSYLEASVNAKTINTGIGLRDRDIQKDKYLNTDKHTSIEFRSEKIEKAGNRYKAVGNLTLKGTKKKIEIPFNFTQNGNSGVFKGNFKINLNDYDIAKGKRSIGDIVTIDLEVPVTK
jgi:polyisoprenoid-binding protein YceI